MNSLQKFFNLIVGVEEPWCLRRAETLAPVRPQLPQRVELPACWRRAKQRRARGCQ